MFARLIEQIGGVLSAPVSETDPDYRDGAIRKATAVLMIDVARADNTFDPSEFDRVLQLVQEHFHLTPEEAALLVNSADEQAQDLTSLHDFTQLLHRHLDEAEKARIVSFLWQVAYADGRLDMFEDSLVLKISDLLHVSRGRVMRLKHDAAGDGEDDEQD